MDKKDNLLLDHCAIAYKFPHAIAKKTGHCIEQVKDTCNYIYTGIVYKFGYMIFEDDKDFNIYVELCKQAAKNL